MRYLLMTAVLAAVALPLGTSANAQTANDDAIARCNQSVGQMKFEGWPADRNRDMMMLACQSNGGSIPGTNAEKPVSLPRGTRQH